MYGIDYEGGVYHEHPVEDPDLHVPFRYVMTSQPLQAQWCPWI